jgi:hypothetical protein
VLSVCGAYTEVPESAGVIVEEVSPICGLEAFTCLLAEGDPWYFGKAPPRPSYADIELFMGGCYGDNFK